MTGGGDVVILCKKIFNSFSLLFPKYSHSGGVLIEFAFSVPILISLLFFVNDHYRFYELKDKARASAYLAATMIQQINNTRQNKQLTKNDLARIAYASSLNLFHTNAMFGPWPLGLYVCMNTWWLKRKSSDNYLYQECWLCTNEKSSSPNNIYRGSLEGTKTQAQVLEIHPNLLCEKDGDERLLIEIHYRKINFDKRKLGLFILEPKAVDIFGTAFYYQVVITPKPGLFPARN